MTSTVALEPNSPLFKLYQKLKADGVTDADLDTGYPETDYLAKTRRTIHKGDHKIEGTEVLNYALERYERYQLAIKETTGYDVPWSLDDLNPATDFDAKVRAKVAQTVGKFKQILTAQGLAEGTDKYQELLALSLYAFALASRPKGSSGATVLKSARQELEKAGLTEIVASLKASGGLGLANKDDCALEATALEALARACGVCTEQSKVLFAVFRAVGLRPKFLFVKTDADGFQGRAKVNHTSLSLKLGGRTRFYDPAMQQPNAAPFYKKSEYIWWFEETGSEALASHYYNLGATFKERGEYDRAISTLRTAFKINPHYPDAHFILGNIYIKKHDLDRAADEYQATVKVDPKNGQAYHNLGSVYRDQGSALEKKDPAAAARLYKNALQAYENARANGASESYGLSRSVRERLEVLGEAEEAAAEVAAQAVAAEVLASDPLKAGDDHFQRNELALALDSYLLVLKNDPNSPAAVLGIWKTYKALGDRGMAKMACERYREVSGDESVSCP